MPYAIFRYDPEEEFELRREVGMLVTRLETGGKRVTRISLAECLDQAMRSQQPLEEWFKAEREMGTQTVVETDAQRALRLRPPRGSRRGAAAGRPGPACTTSS